MALQTDLSRSPYYDDFAVDKNFYRVLYRPGTAVQTRELNQMQTILQDQIDKFGRHIFTEGSVIEGCSFTFDKNYDYVKINDAYSNGTAIANISDFQSRYVYNTNGLTAIIVNTASGFSARDPDLNTIYIKYNNVGTFPNGSIQNIFSNNEVLVLSGNTDPANTTSIVGNITVATVIASTGKGYAFTTTQGVIFQKGFFVNVRPQTLIVSKYSNSPNNISIGFNSIENIVTPEADTSLLDNAAGAPNYAAPGAHRLQLIPTLYTAVTTEATSNTSFFSLVDFKDGVPVSIKDTAEYAALGKQLAKRTYETNGNYIVSPFLLSTSAKNADDVNYHDYVNLLSSRGIGYVEGYRVEYVNNNRINLRKGTDTELISQQTLSANYGNYVYVKEFCGDFDSENIATVELHGNAYKTAVSGREYLGVAHGTAKIGEAIVKGVAYESGIIGTADAVYRLYLTGIIMDNGQNFANVKSIIRYNGAVRAVADIIPTKNATLDADISSVQEPMLNTLIFPMGQSAVKPDGITAASYVYRNKATSSIQTTGIMTSNLPSPVDGSGAEQFNVSGDPISRAEAESFVVIPTANAVSTVKSGNITASSGATTITATSSPHFDTEYRSGDMIRINGEYYEIASVDSASQITLKTGLETSVSANAHYKAFISGIPIDFTQPNRSISISGSTATYTLGDTLLTTLSTAIYHDIKRTNAISIKKNIVKNAFVKINCKTHPNGNGAIFPTWSLGLGDVQKINGIYISNVEDTYANSTNAPDSSSGFIFEDNQSENVYGYSYIRLKTGSTGVLSAKSTMLIDLNLFTHDRSQGVGFFTANSYPIDDVNLANTTAITTAEIPKVVSRKNITYDLRDCVDFRPFVQNVSTVTQNEASASVNPVNVGLDILPAGSYLPSPDSNWSADVVHYLPRKDLAVIDIKGQFKIVEGVSNARPSPPVKPTGTMALGIITIPPYPSLTPRQAKLLDRYDYSITTKITQNKRYTMQEIGTLAQRIDNLEYYTSLNLLEQSTSNMLVKNDTTGLNRFKNGMLVDPFNGHDVGDTLDPNYNISISKGELRPRFAQRQEVFDYDPELSVNTVQVGPYVMLNYKQVGWIAQNYASKVRNCVEGNIFVYKSSVTLTPNYQTSPSLKDTPTVSDTLDLASNWINLKKAWGTQWGNWETVPNSSKSTPSVGDKTETSRQTDAQGNVYKTFNQKTTTTTTTKQTTTGTILDLTAPKTTDIKLGEFVTDVSIMPYIQSARIKFSATGLKPGARLYAYFNNIDVTGWCMLTDLYFTVGSREYIAGGGAPLKVGNDGTIYGYFLIPPSQFQAEELTFMLCDVDNLTTKFNNITTQAIGTYYASKLSVGKGQATLRTRDVVLSSHEVYDEKEIKTTTTDNNVTLEVEQGPKIEPVINIFNDNRVTNNITNNITNHITENHTTVTNVVNNTSVVNNNTVVTPTTVTETKDVSDYTASAWESSGGGIESAYGDEDDDGDDDDCSCEGEDDDDDDDDDDDGDE